MKKIVLYGIFLGVVASVTVLILKQSSSNPKRDFLTEKSQPFDHFYFQRSYPDNQMDYLAYNSELEKIKKNEKQDKNINSDWTLEGPTNIGGRINTIEVDPINANIIYVGVAAGGIFKTINGGSTWQPIADGFEYLAVSDIAIDPNATATIYAATGDHNIPGLPHIGNGVYKSVDGGNNWVHKGLSNECIISRIIIDPNNSNIVYASAMGKPFVRNNFRGVYKSIDAGNTWNQVLFLSPETGVTDMVMDPFNSNTLYCSGWDRIRTNQESMVSGNGGRVWKTTDGGATWNQLTGGLPQTKLSRTGLAISKLTPNLVFASIVDTLQDLQAIYKSTNGGNTWTAIGNSGLDPNALGGFGWYFGQVRVSPYNDNQISILGVELHSTFNGGGSWQKTVPDWWTYQVHADCHDLVYVNANTILLATDGGLYRTTNNMGTWSDIENLPITQFYRIAINPHQSGIYAGGAQDNGTSSGNASSINNWPREFGGDGFQTIYHPTNPSLRYYETQNGSLYYDDGNVQNFDNGINPSDRTNWDSPIIMSSFNFSTMYTGTYRVYKQTGAPYGTWNTISPDLTDGVIFGNAFHTISTIAESPTNQQHLYAGTTDGNVWRTLNGNTWTNVTGILPDRYVTSVVASPTAVSTVYVTHSGYKYNDFIPHIHKSTNNGTTWTDISGDLPQMAINNMMVYPNGMDSVLFVATDAGVYFTSNGGVNWNRVGGNMPLIPVFDLDYDQVNNKLVAGTYARSIQSFPIDSLFPTVITTTGLMDQSKKTTVYPNPTKGLIYFDNLQKQTTIIVYDINGKIMLEQELKENSTINLSLLKQGFYFIKDKNSQQIYKILKQ